VKIAQHAAGSGAVNVQVVSGAAIAGGDDEGLVVDDETDVADETFVEDLVRDGAIVNAAMWFTSDAGARSRSVGFGHFQAPGNREGSSKSVAAADSTNHTGEDARAYIAILVSCTRLSPLSGWGCEGRRLSRECSSSRFYYSHGQRRRANRSRERCVHAPLPPART